MSDDNETIYVGPPSRDSLSITPAPPEATEPQQAADQSQTEHVEIVAQIPKITIPVAVDALPMLTKSTSIRPKIPSTEPDAEEADADEPATGEEATGNDTSHPKTVFAKLRSRLAQLGMRCSRALRSTKKNEGDHAAGQAQSSRNSPAGDGKGAQNKETAKWVDGAKDSIRRGPRPGRPLPHDELGGIQELGKYLASAEHVVSLCGTATDGIRYGIFIVDVDSEHLLLRGYGEPNQHGEETPQKVPGSDAQASPTASVGNSSQEPPQSDTTSTALIESCRFLSLEARKMIEAALECDEDMQREGRSRCAAWQRLQFKQRRRSDTFDGHAQKIKDYGAAKFQHKVHLQVAEVMRKLGNRELGQNPGISPRIWEAATQRANVAMDNRDEAWNLLS